MMNLHARTLQRAADILGGVDALCESLRVPMHRLDAWLSGRETPPMGIFLKAVDVISATSASSVREETQTSGANSRAEETAQRASQMHASVLSVPAAFPGVRRPRSVLAFLHETFLPGEGRAMVESALDAAVEGTGADMGNIQLSRAHGLVIVAQRGFDTPFLEFFACVDKEGTCGAARHAGNRVVVADVQSDPIFADADVAGIMEGARVRAVQSTPLIGATGEILGMLSTHYERPRQPRPQELAVLDHIARRTAFWLDGGAA